MNPLSGVLDEAWQMCRAHAAHLLTDRLSGAQGGDRGPATGNPGGGFNAV